MPTATIAGHTVDVNEEGFMTDPSQWNEEIAQAVAIEEGIPEISEAHWHIIRFLQADYKEKGSMPSIRRVKNEGGIPIKELYELFPKGPLKKAARIAGLPKPAGCI